MDQNTSCYSFMKCLQLPLFDVTNCQWEWHLVGNQLMLSWTLLDSNWNFVCGGAITFWLIFWGFAILLHTQKGLSVCVALLYYLAWFSSWCLAFWTALIFTTWNETGGMTWLCVKTGVCCFWFWGVWLWACPWQRGNEWVFVCLFYWLVFSNKTFSSYMWCQPFAFFTACALFPSDIFKSEFCICQLWIDIAAVK